VSTTTNSSTDNVIDAAGLSDRERQVLDLAGGSLIIGGSSVDASSGKTFGVDDPATHQIIAEVADGTPEDGIAALDAAVAAGDAWARTPPRRRADILRRAFDMMIEREADLALLMTLEMGKPLAESRAEVGYAAEFLRWFSEEAVRIGGQWRSAPDGGSRILTMRQPVGPCLFVTPWNFPLAMGTRKIGPALAAGCTVVVKPAKQTPLSMLALARILREAGLPAGVLNVVTTSRASALVSALLRDTRLRKLSFTGSTEVGRALVAQSATNLLRTSMELGGNAPLIVFDDADIDRAVAEAVRAKLRNNGEACTAANRFYVHDAVYEEFAEKLIAAFARLRLGRGTEPTVDLGPLIDDAGVAKCAELVDDAVARGARVGVGGHAGTGIGSYFEATVLVDVPSDARVMREEVFGPVAPLCRFTDDGQVRDWANDTEFGLASYLFTRDLDRALRMSESLQVGMIGLNRGVLSNTAAPFGGVKASGFGREGGDEGIDEYLSLKYVAVDAPADREAA
jgi:succinate-semialdehyde dehydrogenase/glutarate-semialdehyde dehydrogenase